MSKHHQQQYIYNQPIYTNSNTIQGVNYGAYQSTNYHKTKKTSTKPQEIVYQEQVIEQPQTQYIVEGNTYIPTTQYTQGVQYVTDDQGNLYEYQQEGEIQGYDQNNIYQQPQEQVIYQEQPGEQVIYENLIQPQEQVIYQDQLQQGEQVVYEDQIQTGQEVIYQEQIQPGQQVIYQDPNQIYEQNPQYIKEQRKAKYVKQMVTQKPNMKQISPYQQQEYISRNPNIQNIPQQYIQNNPKYQNQINIQQKNIKQDKPSIDSDFQPDFGLPNSIIGQPQINFEKNPNPQNLNAQMQPQTQYQNQGQQNYINYNQPNQSSYVVPRRNPNKNIKKYDLTNSSHYVNTNDPGARGMNSGNLNNNNYINQSQSSNKGVNMKNKISQEQVKYSIDPNFQKNEQTKQIIEEEDKPEVGEGIPCVNESVNNLVNNNITNNQKSVKINNNDIQINNNNISNNINDLNNNNNINSNINMNNNNININGNENNENYIDNQKSQEEIENENPIEEKVPDVNTMENPDNIIEENYKKYQPHYSAEEVHESKLKQSIDYDDTLDHLPTIDNILKGIENLLPPPNKTKYDE